MTATIRLLTPADAEAFIAIRREALTDAPLAFVESPEDDAALSLEFVREALERGPESVVFGAFAPALVGMLGVLRERSPKAAHKAHVWGVYVAPSERGHGIGRQLVTTALDHVRGLAGVSQVHLSVAETALAAKRLYERMEFETWGTEPSAIVFEGKAVAETHMIKTLTSPTKRE